MPCSYHILLTIDVEDWFQVENLKSAISFESWPTRELRVEKNTHRLLDLFDEVKLENTVDRRQKTKVQRQTPICGKNGQRATDNGQHEKVRATFFVLGWLAERLPNLVREIAARGHEVASHGYGHGLCTESSSEDLREDLARTRKLLEDIIGDRVYGYRAPSFSISDDILRMIADAGYLYDSSYNSFSAHGRYGKISLNGNRRTGIGYEVFDGFYELAISNLPFSCFPILGTLGHFRHFRHSYLPWGGGAYFRLIPALVFRLGVREILRQQQAYLFYIHPWEVDPDQPRPVGIPVSSRFKHYTNLDKTEGKLRSLLTKFHDCRLVTCREYLQEK